MGKPVALDASADERDTRGFISMTIMRPFSGLTANCTFEPPVSTPISRNTAIDALRMIWYSLSVSVWAGATVMESPVCTPMGLSLIHILLPLIMPPFVGAVAMQLIFGRSGSVNLLLNDWFGFTIPFMEGLNGVIFVEALHYFPFILMNLVVALRNIDGAMEEAAFNLGARGFRLFRRVIFPLALPGYVAGTSLVFVKVFDDLGTPLVLEMCIRDRRVGHAVLGLRASVELLEDRE